MQPLIAPLYEGRTIIEVLADVHRRAERQVEPRPREGLLDPRARRQGRRLDDHRRERQPFANSDSFWKHALHDGFVPGRLSETRTRGSRGRHHRDVRPAPTAYRQPEPRPATRAVWKSSSVPIPTIWDGRFANNGWLQELPKPLTKITWDPAALGRARDWPSSRSSRTGDVIELRYRGKTARLPVCDRSRPSRQRGHGVLRLRPPQDRPRRAPASDSAKEFDVYRLRTSDAPWFGGGLEIAKSGGRYCSRRRRNTI